MQSEKEELVRWEEGQVSVMSKKKPLGNKYFTLEFDCECLVRG